MPFLRLRRSIQGQGGSSLIELLVAMPIAVFLLGMVVQALGEAGTKQQTIEHRTEALSAGQESLERMTREIRQAGWVYFRSSSVVDLDSSVRPAPTASSVKKLVRYDCSADVCTRSEGPATAYPPPSSPAFVKSQVVLGDPASDPRGRYGQIQGQDVFRPFRVNATTGAAETDYFDPDYLQVRLQLDIKDRRSVPLVLEDGVTLRNRSNFAG